VIEARKTSPVIARSMTKGSGEAAGAVLVFGPESHHYVIIAVIFDVGNAA
jgi:hypothetical protein